MGLPLIISPPIVTTVPKQNSIKFCMKLTYKRYHEHKRQLFCIPSHNHVQYAQSIPK